MTYEQFAIDASEIFLEVAERTNNLARASMLVADFCALHGQKKEFAAQFCLKLRRAYNSNAKAK